MAGNWLFQRNSAYGYTLAELAAVFALVGIAASLAWPAMNRGLDELYLRQTANQLVRDIRYVQQQAMNNPSGGWKIMFITTQIIDGKSSGVQGWSIHCYENGLSRMQHIRRLPPGSTYLGMNFDHREIRFSELGAPSSAGHVGITNRLNHTLYVIVAPVTGKTRVDTQPPR